MVPSPLRTTYKGQRRTRLNDAPQLTLNGACLVATPQTSAQLTANVELLFAVLRGAGVPVLWEAEDFVSVRAGQMLAALNTMSSASDMRWFRYGSDMESGAQLRICHAAQPSADHIQRRAPNSERERHNRRIAESTPTAHLG